MSSLGLSAGIVRKLILRAQEENSSLKGTGDYSTATVVAEANTTPFPQAVAESTFFDEFFKCFPDHKLWDLLRDKDVLDFGCGYGGKTVDYRLKCGARRVCGIEPHANVIAKCEGYLATRGVDGVEFKVNSQDKIPYPDASFDVVLSHDVLEHVANPLVAIKEIHRVMKPGALSFHVFPVYFGLFSHHLDYIIKIPGIHWMFSAPTLIKAINSVLKERPYIMGMQPEPKLSFDNKHRVLPQLNGLSGWHLDALFDGFEVLTFERRQLLWWRKGWGPLFGAMSRSKFLPMIIRDAATNNVTCVLRKPA